MSASTNSLAAAVARDYRTVALVLQGGGALGAYQAGVFEALDEAGLQPTRLAGNFDRLAERGDHRRQRACPAGRAVARILADDLPFAAVARGTGLAMV